MACFLVSAGEALVVMGAKYVVRHRENKFALAVRSGEKAPRDTTKFGAEIPWSKKLGYLELTLWGGAFLLAGEHVLHGEVVPYPPFLTAASSPEDTATMLHEMGTVGVTMATVLTIAWGIGVLVVDYLKYSKHQKKVVSTAEGAK